MQLIDWIILVSTLLLIVVYGTIKTRGAKSSLDYIKAGYQAKWWTIGFMKKLTGNNDKSELILRSIMGFHF